MPVYSIQVPDGRTLDIQANDEATALNGAKQWYASQPPKPAKRAPAPPTAADARGQRIVDLGRAGPAGSPGYVKALSALPQGAFYRDYQGNVRRNDNGAKGNPIVPVGGASDYARSGKKGALEGLQSMADMALSLSPIGQLSRMQGPGVPKITDLVQQGGALLASTVAGGLGQKDVSARLKRASVAPTSQGRIEQLGGGYAPQTFGGKLTRYGAQAVPGALLPGSLPARIANVVVPAVTSAVGGEVGLAMGGQTGEQIGAAAGGLAGGLATGLRVPGPKRVPRVQNKAVDKLLEKAPQDVAAMRAAADEFRSVGINPTLTDVVNEGGRGVIRAAAAKPVKVKRVPNVELGRDKVRQFSEQRAVDLPTRIGDQAKTYISPETKTPDVLRAEISDARRVQADQQFGAVRMEPVSLDADTVQALRSPDGRKAIKDAAANAMNSLDPETRNVAAQLNTLADAALDNPGGTQINIGMAQEISSSLFDAAKRAEVNGAPTNQSRLLGNLARAVRNNARTQVGGYDEALSNYEASSKLISAADTGENLTRRDTDQFVSEMSGMNADQRQIAQATGRRAIQRQVGENPAAAPGFAKTYAMGSEPTQRLTALVGPEKTADFQRAITLERRAFENATDIAPRLGAKTQGMFADTQNLDDAQSAIMATGKLARGDVVGALFDGGRLFLRRFGIDENTIDELTRLAVDPQSTDAVIAYIQQQYGPRQAQAVLKFRADPAVAALIAAQSTSAKSVEMRLPQ